MRSRSIVPRRSAGVVAIFLCTGCVPMNVTRSPGVTGVVVDAGSGAPVAGAEVLVSKAIFAADPVASPGGATVAPPTPPLSEALTAARRPTATTGVDGRFTIPPERRWVMTILGSPPSPPSGTVVVRRAGYTPLLREVTGRTADLGSVAIAPAP